MSENEKKDIERDATEEAEESSAASSSPTEDAPDPSTAEADEAASDKAEEGDDAAAAAGADSDDDAAAEQSAASDDEATTQSDAPSEEELTAAEKEVEEDSNIESGPNEPSDPSEFRNLVANAAGITGPDQPKEMFASEDSSLTDDELRARGMEKDEVPIAPLVAMVVVLTIFLGVSSLGLLQLYRYVTDDLLVERNWSVVDPQLAEQRAQNRELLSSAGEAWGDAPAAEVRIPIAVAQSLLVGSPEWLERHPLAPVPEAAAPVLDPTAEEDEGGGEGAEEGAEGGSETIDSPDGDPTEGGGEAVEEQADEPSPAGDDSGADAPGEEDEN